MGLTALSALQGRQLTWINLAVKLDFVRFHHFLDNRTHFTQSDIDASFLYPLDDISTWTYLDAGVCGGTDRLQQGIVFLIERKSKGRVDDPAIDMHSEINFTDISKGQSSGVSGIGGVMSGAVVDRAAGGKSNA